MADCKQIEEMLEAYADGELHSEQAALVAQHVANCPHCKALLDEYLALNAAITDCALQAPEGFAERVMAAVDREKAAPVKPQGRGARLGKIAPWIGIGVAAMLCLSIASSSLVKFVIKNFADPDISVDSPTGGMNSEVLGGQSPEVDSYKDSMEAPAEPETEAPSMDAPSVPDTEQEQGTYEEPTYESPTYEETAVEGVESVTNAPTEGTMPPMEESDEVQDSVPDQTFAESAMPEAPTDAPTTETDVVMKPESVQPAPETEMQEQLTEAPADKEFATEPVADSAPEGAPNRGLFARIWQSVKAFIESLWQAISRLFGGEA